MSTHATTAISTPTGDRTTSAVSAQPAASRSLSRRKGTPLSLTRLVSVELRKNFDTRSGRWLLVSLGGAAVLTTGAIIAWTPAEQLTFSQFTLAIGVPMTVILPPHHRAVGDHGVESALRASHLHPRSASRPRPAGQGHRRGPGRRARHSGGLRCRRTGEHGCAALADVPVVWDQSAAHVGNFALGQTLLLLVGFAWFADARPWLDAKYSQDSLLSGELAGDGWSHLAVTSLVWLVVPMVVAVVNVLRSEVK
jgi:ABC-2 type transport system permease protein